MVNVCIGCMYIALYVQRMYVLWSCHTYKGCTQWMYVLDVFTAHYTFKGCTYCGHVTHIKYVCMVNVCIGCMYIALHIHRMYALWSRHTYKVCTYGECMYWLYVHRTNHTKDVCIVVMSHI